MAAITYKTVISQAIADFNSIQNSLHTKMPDVVTSADSSSSTTLIPTQSLPDYIREYLVFPTGNLNITASNFGTGVIKVATDYTSGSNRTGYSTITIAQASDWSATTAGSGLAVGTKNSNGKYPVSATIKTTATPKNSGWSSTTGELTSTGISIGSLDEASISLTGGAVSGSTNVNYTLGSVKETNSDSGYSITITSSGSAKRGAVNSVYSAGYLPTKASSVELAEDTNATTLATAEKTVFIKAGSVSSGATITATTLTGSTGLTLLEEAPAGTLNVNYFELRPYATANSSMTFVDGYISSKGEEGSASSTTKKTYYINAASQNVTAGSFSFTPVMSNGSAETDTKVSGTVKLYTENSVSTSEPDSGYYLKLKTSGISGNTSGKVETTEGYVKQITETNVVSPANVSETTYYARLKEGSKDIVESQELTIPAESQTYTLSGGTLTVHGSSTSKVRLKSTEGYISEDTGTNSSTSITIKSANKVFDLVTLAGNLKPENIKSGVSIFGVEGTLSASGLLPDLPSDAEASYILAGFKAYSDNGTAITGTMADFSIAADKTNAAGATGAGLNITPSMETGFTPSLSASGATYTLRSYMGSTGYVKKDTTYIDAEVPTEAVQKTMTSNQLTVTPTSGKLLRSVEVSMANAGFSGGSIIPSYTEITSAISGATNISDSAKVLSASDSVSGYILKLNIAGSGSVSSTSAGFVGSNVSVGTVSLADTLTIKVDSATIGSWLTTSNTGLSAVTKGFVGQTYYAKKATVSSNLTTTNTGYAAISETGVVDTVQYIKAGELGTVTSTTEITANTTSASESGKAAVINNSATTYVTVSATGTAKGNIVSTPGWVPANTSGASDGSNASAKIAAVVNPTVSAGEPSANFTTTGATTYSSENGSISTASSKTATGTIASVNVLNASDSYKDKYIIGTFTAKTNAGTATANLHADATGETVDEYVESLYKRILGQPYTDVEADL